jgi:hypothetical protein
MSNTKLVLLGDVHGSATAIVRLDRALDEGIPILQVGDLGWYPGLRDQWQAVGASLRRPLYWIRGNHEHYPAMPWLNANAPVEVAPNPLWHRCLLRRYDRGHTAHYTVISEFIVYC